MAGSSKYQYETSPRKLQPEYKPTKKKSIKKSNNIKIKKEEAKKKQNRLMLYIMLGFLVLFAISYRNSVIGEEFAQVKQLQEKLALLEKENEQLEVNIESSLNLNNVEQAAKELLGMQKLDNGQTIQINLPRQDYVEPATEKIIIEKEQGWFQSLISRIAKILE